MLVLGDSLASVSAASRMRAHSRTMLGIMRRIGALSLESGSSFCIRWIPSEYNVADGPSRGRGEP
eukprot:2312169-Pyramimonas_sp.AAC.1